jgi:hypothetical protein
MDLHQGMATVPFHDREIFWRNPKSMLALSFTLWAISPTALNVVWAYQIHGSGTGKAFGGEGPGIAGTYHITYYNFEGRKLVKNTLEITLQTGDHDLTWYKDGAIVTRGIGCETPAGLIAGIRFLPD